MKKTFKGKYKNYKFENLLKILNNYKEYKNFNFYGFCLGLNESVILNLDQKLQIVKLIKENKKFRKSFDWFKIKDISLFISLEHLGESMEGTKKSDLYDFYKNQGEKYLKKHQKIKGGFAKSCNCGYCRDNSQTQNRKDWDWNYIKKSQRFNKQKRRNLKLDFENGILILNNIK